MRVATLGELRGVIVSLADDCRVTASYLGTEPALLGMHSAANAHAKQLDYDGMDEEHRKLLRIIRQAANATMAEPTQVLTLRAQVATDPSRSELRSDLKGVEAAKDGHSGVWCVLVRLHLSYNGPEELKHITLALGTSDAFHVRALGSGVASADMPVKSLVVDSLRGGRTPEVRSCVLCLHSNNLCATSAAGDPAGVSCH
jgi:hypothetical protein